MFSCVHKYNLNKSRTIALKSVMCSITDELYIKGKIDTAINSNYFIGFKSWRTCENTALLVLNLQDYMNEHNIKIFRYLCFRCEIWARDGKIQKELFEDDFYPQEVLTLTYGILPTGK